MPRKPPETNRGRLLWEAAERAGFSTTYGLARHLAKDNDDEPSHEEIERWRRQINRWTAEDGSVNRSTAEHLSVRLGTEVDYWPTERPKTAQRVTDLEDQVRRLREAVGELADEAQRTAARQQAILDELDALRQLVLPKEPAQF